MSEQVRGKVLGIGGVFFKSQNAPELREWYANNLGIRGDKHGVVFPWRSAEGDGEHLTAWSIFPSSSTYFDPSSAPFLFNYIVEDLDELLARLESQGVRIDPKRDNFEYGRFAWIYDLDGNKIELWEPAKG